MSCGTGLRQVDRLGPRFDQLKLDTTLEFLQLISSKIEGQGATGMPDVEEFFGHRGRWAGCCWDLGCVFQRFQAMFVPTGLGDAIRRDVNRGTKVIKSALELLGQASRDEERVHACVERTIPAVEELLRPVVVGRVPISAPPFFREFDVWQQLLAVALPERSLALWRGWIKELIGRRLRAYEDRSLLELFCHDRTDENIQGLAHEILVEEVTRAVKALASLGKQHLQSLLSYRGSNSKMAMLSLGLLRCQSR